MTERTEARLHELLERAAVDARHGTLESKAGDFYAAFMDQARVDSLGAKPIATELAAVRAASTAEQLAALTGRSTTGFEFPLFVPYIDVDLKDPTRYAVYLTQGGLGLPDRDYYLEPSFESSRQAYARYVARMLALLDWPDAESRAADVVALETAIARGSWTKAQQRDLLAVYNPMSVDELERWAPGFAWRKFLDAAGLGQVQRVVVAEKSAFPGIARTFAEAKPATLRAWQAFHVVDNAAPYLAAPFVEAHFELHYRTLSGQQEQRARWKRALAAVAGADASAGDNFGTFGTLGYAVGQLYTAKYFPPEAKAKIEALVANVKTAFRARLERLDWMGPATRREALRKLDTYTIKVGYPDHPRDYSRVEIRRDDLVGNVRRAAANDWAFYTGRLFGPVDSTDWLMTPQTNNAYNGSLRDIVFPAGILQAPMFDPDADPAINYGAIGGVIGHELTHGFDDEGRKIDADGALRDWWTPEDARQFEARARRLGAQYDAFEPLPGVHVNGTLTMGENIADLGGLAVALDAYHASLQGAPAPVLDGLSGDQRVLLGWAQAWRGKVTDAFVRKQVVSDPHSPRQFRVLGPTRNIDAWYEAFRVQPGDRMYLPPAERVKIW
jgi:putative endopeptidase